MIRALLSLAMLLLAVDAHAATLYVLIGGVAAPRAADFQPPCQSGRCTNYRSDNVVTGWFTTREPLPANLNRVDIYPRLLAYAFADGVNLHTSANPESRVQSFVVSTSASGRVSVERLWLITWTSGTRPHTPGDRLNSLTLSGGYAVAQNNDACNGVSSRSGFGVETGIDDACALVKPDGSSSVAQTDNCFIGGVPNCSAATVSWTQQSLAIGPAMAIPALSPLSMVLLVLTMTLLAATVIPAGSPRPSTPSTTSPSRRAGTGRIPPASS